MSLAERNLVERFRALPPRARRGMLRILDALGKGADPADIDFDLWTRFLARRKGFDDLRASDVLREVRNLRRP